MSRENKTANGDFSELDEICLSRWMMRFSKRSMLDSSVGRSALGEIKIRQARLNNVAIEKSVKGDSRCLVYMGCLFLLYCTTKVGACKPKSKNNRS